MATFGFFSLWLAGWLVVWLAWNFQGGSSWYPGWSQTHGIPPATASEGLRWHVPRTQITLLLLSVSG